MALSKTSNTKKNKLIKNEVMCKKEEAEFDKIKRARDRNLKRLKDGKISKQEFAETCDTLIARLDALKARYD